MALSFYRERRGRSIYAEARNPFERFTLVPGAYRWTFVKLELSRSHSGERKFQFQLMGLVLIVALRGRGK